MSIVSKRLSLSSSLHDAKGRTTASDIRRLTTGINIGNTMEVPSGETGWGNPKVNQDYIKGLKALGFNAVTSTVRATFCANTCILAERAVLPSLGWVVTVTVDPLVARVDEVVGWIVAEDMYAIVNIHWDGGWLEENVHLAYDEALICPLCRHPDRVRASHSR